MPRGGARQGTPGRAYGNRSDLNGPKPPGTPLPVTAAAGQPYGARKAQEDAQRAVPMAAGLPAPAPTQVPSLAEPSSRPDEPVTSGLPMGPGAGPEALTAFPADQSGVADLASYLPMLEFIASQPGSSPQTRQLVRRLRAGQAPL